MNNKKGALYFSVGFAAVCAILSIGIGYVLDAVGTALICGVVLIGCGYLFGLYAQKQAELPENLANKGILLHVNNAIHKEGLPELEAKGVYCA